MSSEVYIVVGATGQTGLRLVEGIRESAPDAKVIGTSRSSLDLEKPQAQVEDDLAALATKVRANSPSKVRAILCGAFTNVEGCEADPEKCYRVNRDHSILFLEWAKREFGAQLVFFSTDYVFDGKSGPYSETDTRNALSHYGKAKQQVEEWLERNHADALIVRTTGVYDYLAGSKNFLMQMLELWKHGKETTIPDDQEANPVWAKELAAATVQLLRKNERGIFHIGGGRQMPRIDFARLIAETFGYPNAKVKGVQTSQLNQKAKRPLLGGLRCDKLEKALGWAPSAPEKILAAFAREQK